MAHVLEPTTVPRSDPLAGLGETREEAAQALEVLKQIEKSGGSAAFETWLEETDNGTNVPTPPELSLNLASEADSTLSAQSNTWSKVYNVSCKMYTAYVRTVLEVDIEGTEFAGKGSAWGFGMGYSKFRGELTLEGGETIQSLVSSVDKFVAVAGARRDDKMLTGIVFYNKDGKEMAKLLSSELNFITGFSGFASSFKFSRALDILKRIEQSGGSAAFEAWLKETDNGTNVLVPPELEAEIAAEANSAILSSNFAALSADSATWSGDKVYPVFIKIFSIAAYSIIEMTVEGTNYKGSGGAWGVGVGYFRFSAHLYLQGGRDIESLLSDVSRFWFSAGASAPLGVGGAIVKFYDNDGNDIGSAKGFGMGLIGGIGFKGDFKLFRE